MYRRYENPYALERELAELQKELAENPLDEELAFAVQELKDRINFAWQDDEFDAEGIEY